MAPVDDEDPVEEFAADAAYEPGAPFCSTCTRARLTAVGELYTCLFAAHGRDLRGLLRGGVDDDALHAAIAAAWGARDDRYSELRGLSTVDLPKPEMSYLGG